MNAPEIEIKWSNEEGGWEAVAYIDGEPRLGSGESPSDALEDLEKDLGTQVLRGIYNTKNGFAEDPTS